MVRVLLAVAKTVLVENYVKTVRVEMQSNLLYKVESYLNFYFKITVAGTHLAKVANRYSKIVLNLYARAQSTQICPVCPKLNVFKPKFILLTTQLVALLIICFRTTWSKLNSIELEQ